MIPRKRLQVLLYILQICYVFGDGDPGGDPTAGLLPSVAIDEIPSNDLMESYSSTTSSDGHHVIRRLLLPTLVNGNNSYADDDGGESDSDKMTREIVLLQEEPEDELTVDHRDTGYEPPDEDEEVVTTEVTQVDDVTNDYPSSLLVTLLSTAAQSSTAAPSTTTTISTTSTTVSSTSTSTEANHLNTVIEELRVTERHSTWLNVTWSTSGDNATEFFVELYQGDLPVRNATTQWTNYTLTGLEPCTGYRIGVSANLYASGSESMAFVDAATTYATPGQPQNLTITASKKASLFVQWLAPATAANCVGSYRITYDNQMNETRQNGEKESNETSCTFDGLHACTIYTITVTPISLNGSDGLTSALKSDPTFHDVTGPPLLDKDNPESTKTAMDELTLVYAVSNKTNNCPIISVISECKNNRSNSFGIVVRDGVGVTNLTAEERPKNVSVSVRGLTVATLYRCRARSLTSAGLTDWSNETELWTHENVTTVPQKFAVNANAKYATFTWKNPDEVGGILLNYRMELVWEPLYEVPDHCHVDRGYVNASIKPKCQKSCKPNTSEEWVFDYDEANVSYTAYLSAQTRAGWSEKAKVQFISLKEGLPDKVTRLRYSVTRRQDDPNSLDTLISWSLPCRSRGIVSKFNVYGLGTRDKFKDHALDEEVVVGADYKGNDSFNVSLGELKPAYRYTFNVTAMLVGFLDEGEVTNISFTYPSGIPPKPDARYIKNIMLQPHQVPRTTSMAEVILPMFQDTSGEIKYYAILVSGAPFPNRTEAARMDVRNDWPDVATWREAMQQDFKIPYQATIPRWAGFPSFVQDYGTMKAIKYEIGKDTTCPDVSLNTPENRVYCNGPLKSDTWYEIRMRAFTDQGYSDSVSFSFKTNAELNIGLVLGVIFGILFIGIFTTLMLLVKRCSFRLFVQRILQQSNIPESPVPNPFNRRKFLNHCQQLAENPGKLSNEFQLLQTLSIDLQMPSNTACLQANRKKNRYSDILPYDFSRVKLEIIDNDPNSDYINASYVKGYSGNNEYIACQGPKEDTTYDFWRMIDQYDVKMIVMLTQLVERGKEKCHQYYPTIRETFNYEKLSIKCTSELDYRTYTQRTFLLQREEKKSTITHLHFKDWPDHDVPDDFDAMIHFCQIFRKQLAAVKGLAVIHCSAGIGRTGTLIAIDILLQSIRENRKLDVFGTVYRLRRHRLNMVQRESQYAYIYNCIRQVLKNPYFMKSYKPPPIDPIYQKKNAKKDKSDSSTDLVESFETLRKNSLSTSIDSMQPLCQSSPQTTPKIPMNGLRYCKSTSAIDTKSNHNRIGRYNSEGYALCDSARDSYSTTSKESVDENDLKSSSSSLYENVEPLIRPSSSQTIAGSNYYLTNDSVEKDTSL